MRFLMFTMFGLLLASNVDAESLVHFPVTLEVNADHAATIQNSNGQQIVLYFGVVNSTPGSALNLTLDVGLSLVMLPELENKVIASTSYSRGILSTTFQQLGQSSCDQIASSGAQSTFFSGLATATGYDNIGSSLKIFICNETLSNGTNRRYYGLSFGGSPTTNPYNQSVGGASGLLVRYE